jgi:predicted RNase H-like nuclease (RuvC/YqgF family)
MTDKFFVNKYISAVKGFDIEPVAEEENDEDLREQNNELLRKLKDSDALYNYLERELEKCNKWLENSENLRSDLKKKMGKELQNEKSKVEVLEKKLIKLEQTIVERDMTIFRLKEQSETESLNVRPASARGRSRRKYRGKKPTTSAP